MINKQLNKISERFKKGVLHLFKRTATDTSKNNHFDRDGIDHNHGVIPNFIKNSDTSFNTNVENFNCDLIRGNEVKTAVYLASGDDTVENLLYRYTHIQGINNLILIDYKFGGYECITVNDSFRIFTVPSEVVKSSKILDKCGVKIDILIDINCGINLGNGYFSTTAVLVQSLFEPLCNNERFIFIGSRAYQKCNQQYKPARDYLNCFQYENKKTINSDNLIEFGFRIDLPSLTTYAWSSKEIDITLFSSKKENRDISIKKGSITLHFVQGNIFTMKNELDLMLMYYRNLFMYHQFNRTIINALDFRGKYSNKTSINIFAEGFIPKEEYNFMLAQDLVGFANKYHVNRVGFIPLKGFDYGSYINSICTTKSEITDLYFYYYDQKDLTNIYQIEKMG